MDMIISYITRIYDVVFRDVNFITRYYKPFAWKKGNTRYVFMVDGKIPHGGLFDRLKGAISIYAICKSLHKDFKIHFIYPFDLRDYLVPNSYDWTVDSETLCYHYPAARPVRAYGEYQYPSRLFKNRKGETHFYYGYNSLDKINEHFGTCYEWGQLYRELFKPNVYLQSLIDYYKKEIGSDYIVIHLRFLNLLGDKIETHINPELNESDKQKLMAQCFQKIKELEAESTMRVMLASDSMIFIGYVQDRHSDIYVVPGVVRHIDTAGKTKQDENLKVFIDYYLIAGAKKIYNIVGKGMWKSAFSEYPAMIGNTQFERIYL